MYNKPFVIAEAGCNHMGQMSIAKDLIETSNISIGSAAAEAGFADSNYFSRAFRKTYGVNPSDCRNKKSENLNKRKSIVTEK